MKLEFVQDVKRFFKETNKIIGKVTYRYTNAGLKISPYSRVHIKIIPWKLHILKSKSSRVIYL